MVNFTIFGNYCLCIINEESSKSKTVNRIVLWVVSQSRSGFQNQGMLMKQLLRASQEVVHLNGGKYCLRFTGGGGK